MRKIITLKSFSFLYLLLIFTTKVIAGDTLSISPRLYHIDHNKNIIIISQSTNAINIRNTNTQSHISLDHTYQFDQPVRQISTDSSYKVSLADSVYTLYFTQLPIIHINTSKAIEDSPDVYAQFTMVEESGLITQSNIGVQIRGAYSQTFPKKSYELSFWNDTVGAVDRDVRLLNMREDNKWNLQAMYNEPLRINSKVANELWLDIHEVYYKALEPTAKNGISMAYVELFVNDNYRGIYALSERVDRKQLKLKKYNNGIKGELYKGVDWGGAVTFTDLPPFENTSSNWGGFEYKHPEEEVNWTNLYNFVDFVKNSSNQNFYSAYKQKFDINNAVDYYILLNFLRAGDNYGKNIYIAKYKTGDPYFYVPWDLDGVFGIDWQGNKIVVTNGILSNGFYDRLINDCSPGGFRSKLIQRWTELRASIITEDNILAKIQANQEYLSHNRVYEREEIAWNTYSVDTNHLPYLTTWLRDRLSYLDGVFSQQCAPLSAPTAKQEVELKLYPNPTSDYLTIESDALPYELSILDMRGKTVLKSNLKGAINKVDLRLIAKGMYVVTVKNSKAVQTKKLLIN
ncbi:CotH kinase family protein [Hymenobacter sp. YC55]|uniref:CotH kinase family protein n=1 Tax=Hymenobacter sp. YC55 TaxID=3034019 RepID=UPI0023F81140|nr:CotH kinase family protein [Hymenobacter sp. YC55]MDF7814702.1 CotH kinase family protein [Hymenobacter sp. YC55]